MTWSDRQRRHHYRRGTPIPLAEQSTQPHGPNRLRLNANWRDHALCKGMPPDIFFPPRGTPTSAHQAQAICRRCPVQTDCLQYALDANEKAGVWGGTTGRDRRKLKGGR